MNQPDHKYERFSVTFIYGSFDIMDFSPLLIEMVVALIIVLKYAECANIIDIIKS